MTHDAHHRARRQRIECECLAIDLGVCGMAIQTLLQISAARRFVLAPRIRGEAEEDEKEGRLHAENIMSIHCFSLPSMIIKFHDA